MSPSVAATLGLCLALGSAPAAGVCPWCENDPARMAAAGVISHGPIAIGPHGSAAIEERFPEAEWVFVETAHLRWGASFRDATLDAEERKRLRPELDLLRARLPSIPKDVRKLDRWLRAHLLAQRGESLYQRFQALLGVTDADFPESRAAEGPFMGNGRFLGEKDKFEVVIHEDRATHHLFTESFCGVAVTDTVRWHFRESHKLLVSVPAQDADLRRDKWLWPHVVHNLGHAFLSAYKHFSYDPPCWLDEGLALALEKEVEPESATACGEEGRKRDGRGPKDWGAYVRKLVASGKARTCAELLRVQAFSELDLASSAVVWSRVRFLIEQHPDSFARFLGGIKGQLDEQGVPTGRDLPGLQRGLMKELWSWQPATFDEAWKSWLLP